MIDARLRNNGPAALGCLKRRAVGTTQLRWATYGPCPEQAKRPDRTSVTVPWCCWPVADYKRCYRELLPVLSSTIYVYPFFPLASSGPSFARPSALSRDRREPGSPHTNRRGSQIARFQVLGPRVDGCQHRQQGSAKGITWHACPPADAVLAQLSCGCPSLMSRILAPSHYFPPSSPLTSALTGEASNNLARLPIYCYSPQIILHRDFRPSPASTHKLPRAQSLKPKLRSSCLCTL